MKNLVEKLNLLESDIAKEKERFELFALFLREDAPDLWDVLISASWITKNKEESIKYIAGKIRKALSSEELLKLSRIVVLERDNPALTALQKTIHIEHGKAEIKDINFSGLQIKHAYLITSRQENK